MVKPEDKCTSRRAHNAEVSLPPQRFQHAHLGIRDVKSYKHVCPAVISSDRNHFATCERETHAMLHGSRFQIWNVVVLTASEVSQKLEARRLKRILGANYGQSPEYFTQKRWEDLRYNPSYSELNVFIDEPPYTTVWRRAAGQYGFDWTFPPDLPHSLFAKVDEVGDFRGSFAERMDKFTWWTKEGKMRPGWTLKVTTLREFIVLWPDDIKAAGTIGADFFCDLEPIFDGTRQIFWPWPQRIPFEFNEWVNGLQRINFPNYQPANHPLSFCLVECYLDLKCLNECYTWLERRRERLQLFRWFISQIHINMALLYYRKIMLKYEGELPCRFLAMDESKSINRRVGQGPPCTYRTVSTLTDWFTGQEIFLEGSCCGTPREWGGCGGCLDTYFITCEYEHEVRTHWWFREPSYLHSILAPHIPLRFRPFSRPDWQSAAERTPPPSPPSSGSEFTASPWEGDQASEGDGESALDIADLQDLEGYDTKERESVTEALKNTTATNARCGALRRSRIRRCPFHRATSRWPCYKRKERYCLCAASAFGGNGHPQKHSRPFNRGKLPDLRVQRLCCRRFPKRHRKFNEVKVRGRAANAKSGTTSKSLADAGGIPRPNFQIYRFSSEEELSARRGLLVFVDEPPYTTIFRRLAGQPPFDREIVHDESWLLPKGTVVDGFAERFAAFTAWTAAGAMRPHWTLRVSTSHEFIVLWDDDLRGAGVSGDAFYCDLLPIFDGTQQLFWPWPQDFLGVSNIWRRFTAVKPTKLRQGLETPSLYPLLSLVVLAHWIDRHERMQLFRWLLTQQEQNWVLYTYSCRIHGDKVPPRAHSTGRYVHTLLRKTIGRGSPHMYREIPLLGEFAYVPKECRDPRPKFPKTQLGGRKRELMSVSQNLITLLAPTMPEPTCRWIREPIGKWSYAGHLVVRGEPNFDSYGK